MPDTSPRLDLPFVQPAQAQKHVTVNEGLARLDALVQASVISRGVSVPPAVSQAGDSFIIPIGATGLWTGQDNRLAIYHQGGWEIIAPGDGWLVYVQDEDQLLRYLNSDWDLLPLSQSTAMLGINGVADITNRFVCQSEGVVFNHVGSHQRTTLNKAASDDDASHNYQTGFSSRALVGLLGSDDYTVKVSDDGSTFTDALSVDHTSGQVHLPQGIRLGGVTPAHTLQSYETGTWIPTLGTIAAGDLAAATGLTVTYAYYVKIGALVKVNFGFNLTGVASSDFTQKSTVQIASLPFSSRNDGGSVDQGGVTGFVYESIGTAQVSMLGGGVSSPDSLYLFVFHTGVGEARMTDRFHVSATYMTDV